MQQQPLSEPLSKKKKKKPLSEPIILEIVLHHADKVACNYIQLHDLVDFFQQYYNGFDD